MSIEESSFLQDEIESATTSAESKSKYFFISISCCSHRLNERVMMYGKSEAFI